MPFGSTIPDTEDTPWAPAQAWLAQKEKVKERLVLTSLRSRVILGSLDVLVDIGVPAEKEVIL
jgi:hypothetical protein